MPAGCCCALVSVVSALCCHPGLTLLPLIVILRRHATLTLHPLIQEMSTSNSTGQDEDLQSKASQLLRALHEGFGLGVPATAPSGDSAAAAAEDLSVAV